MLNWLNEIELFIRKTSKEFDKFILDIIVGIERIPKEEEKEEKKELNQYYGFWKSLYLVIFKNKRVEK
jgi:hypothetical protein